MNTITKSRSLTKQERVLYSTVLDGIEEYESSLNEPLTAKVEKAVVKDILADHSLDIARRYEMCDDSRINDENFGSLKEVQKAIKNASLSQDFDKLV